VKIFVPKETNPDEPRVPLVPGSVKRLVALGAEVVVQSGLGQSIHCDDAQYTDAGASLGEAWEADMVLRLGKPSTEDVDKLRPGCIHVSYLEPFESTGLIRHLAEKTISAICMEMIPRTTLAQKMDALSSQASLAGYVAVVLAAERLGQIFPMMNTPAGTIAPARVFVIGAGVAGLQAIATAKRLGARVEAFDTRPVVREQVESLGGKFVEVDLGETGQTKDGYAKELTPEQIDKQRQAMAKCCANADVVITTAQVFGRKAPLIVTDDMVAGMKSGSVVVDLAVESGGNVAGSELGKEVTTDNGVLILGLANLPGRVPVHASQMYSSNLHNLINHYWATPDAPEGSDERPPGAFELKLEDEIIQGCLVTHDGKVVNEMIRKHIDTESTETPS
jgi:H+-translocating NAD(P) transhydrogenase subunit alpha